MYLLKLEIQEHWHDDTLTFHYDCGEFPSLDDVKEYISNYMKTLRVRYTYFDNVKKERYIFTFDLTEEYRVFRVYGY